MAMVEVCRNSARKFQSAPLREGRFALGSAIARSIMFQSAPLREGRCIIETCFDVQLVVSIRAPAGGAIDHAR